MAQQHFMFNDYTAPDPDEDGYSPAFAVISTDSSGRTMRGPMINTVLFTVEAYNMKWTDLPASDASKILNEIIGKNKFNFYHYNIMSCKWETGEFYVANINVPFYRLVDGDERVSELSFQVTGINPV